MSSSASGSEYNSPTGSVSSQDQFGSDVLNQLDLVKSLLNQEVWYANRRITRSVAKGNSVVQERVSFFENKSLNNLTTASADFLHNIPIYYVRFLIIFDKSKPLHKFYLPLSIVDCYSIDPRIPALYLLFWPKQI